MSAVCHAMVRARTRLAFAALASIFAGCDSSWSNSTASLGGETAGERGQIEVLFINNTPHRAVFTFGTYDSADPNSEPDFLQFGPSDFDANLDGDSSSTIISLRCARVFSIGSPKLLELIRENLPDEPLSEDALVEGVGFLETASDETAEDEAEPEDGEPAPAGGAAPFEALIGIDFGCGSLLIVRLEIDDLGPEPFRVDYEFIPSESGR